MMIEMQFNSIAQLQRLQEIASSCDDEIFLHSLDDSVRVDAKSFIGLFTLDFTQPVKVVTDSDYLARKVEHLKHKMEKYKQALTAGRRLFCYAKA